MLIDLSDQIAIVTGAAHRVGKAIAVELARAGVHVVIHYNSAEPDQVRDTVQEIKSFGVDALAVQADLSTSEGVATLFDAVREHHGRLDILINSASVFPQGDLLDVSLEEWQQTLDVNVTAPFLCTQAAVRLMRENTPVSGVIVNIVDKGAVSPWPQRPHHGISKAALWMLTQTCAIEFAPEIRVNAVLPGPVLAPPGMPEKRWHDIGETQTLVKRTGSAQDVARAVVFLVREDFITGALIHVNGGEHLTHA
mgnify:CR=1 FL=1